MKHPRGAQGTHVTVPAPTWDPCPLSVLPGVRGTLCPSRETLQGQGGDGGSGERGL